MYADSLLIVVIVILVGLVLTLTLFEYGNGIEYPSLVVADP